MARSRPAAHLSLVPRPDLDALRDALLPVLGETFAPTVARLDRHARGDGLILLCGPTGAGKSRLARWCWRRSARAAQPFVVADLHCSSDGLRGSDLFGHRRGAFTGADSARPGLLREAHRGTLFLDEIDKLDLDTQAMLLRALEDGEHRELGGGNVKSDVRFIVGTNADLGALVEQGRFREDLYYRIHVLPVTVLPLRQRADEIAPWARHMLRELSRQRRGDAAVVLSADAGALLSRQPWPGNLRQLHNVVQRAWHLAQEADGAGIIAVEAEHCAEALALERAPGRADVASALDQLSAALVDAAQARLATGEAPLPLDLASALSGLVLAEASRRTGSLRAAFELFGLGRQLPGGNYLQTWRRERGNSLALCAALGAEPPATLA